MCRRSLVYHVLHLHDLYLTCSSYSGKITRMIFSYPSWLQCLVFINDINWNFLTYLQECTISGILLAVTQIACATGLHYNEPFLYKQLIANIIIFVATNIAGILTHYPCEVAQRQAFMETRQCIEARLTTQRENQQQV